MEYAESGLLKVAFRPSEAYKELYLYLLAGVWTVIFMRVNITSPPVTQFKYCRQPTNCAGIGGTDEEATVVAYVTKMINALGIGDYVKTTTMTTELGKKVDKVEGSRLMTNAEGTKLAAIAAGAQANVIEKIKVNGTEVTPAAEDKSIALTIPTGKLAGKDIVAETDLDAALKEKVNAAAEGNHSHANKAFLDTLSGATDEEVTAMCTEVFGA